MAQQQVPAPIVGVAAGVPYLAVPPPASVPVEEAAVVVAWHLMDPPRSEAALAAALPLGGLPAWRIYLGLPLCGARRPAGGEEEVLRMAYEDAVLNLHGPVATGGAEEFPAALAELRRQLRLPDGPLGLLGGSMGSAVAALVLAETAPAAGIPVAAAVLVSPVVQLRPVVDALGRRFGVTYPWSPEAGVVADRLDLVARAGELAGATEPAVRLVVGSEDDPEGFLAPAHRLREALADAYQDPSRVDVVVVPGMGHALAEEPGVEPAPQTPHAAAVDGLAVEWMRRHLR